MNQNPEFKAFESIPRLKRGCVISEKLDGTNGIVWVSDDLTEVRAGSRSRWITPEDDNYEFAGWVAKNAEALKALGPGYHYGEWWGTGIQRRYGLHEKRWTLFNSGRWGEGGPDEAKRPACCSVVPVLYRGEFSTDAVNAVLEKLRTEGSVAAPGYMKPEGVVVYLQAARALFKVTLDGDGHKGAAMREVAR